MKALVLISGTASVILFMLAGIGIFLHLDSRSDSPDRLASFVGMLLQSLLLLLLNFLFRCELRGKVDAELRVKRVLRILLGWDLLILAMFGLPMIFPFSGFDFGRASTFVATLTIGASAAFKVLFVAIAVMKIRESLLKKS